MIRNNKNKGFTLIELMVVISIIALLSSIVLTSVKQVRDKAVAAKFKSEMKQFISAIELYTSTAGTYPALTVNVFNSNSNTVNYPGDLTVLVPKYISALPKVPPNSFNQGSWAYRFLLSNKNGTPYYKCADDTKSPPYVIIFYPSNPFIFSLYSDLPDLVTVSDGQIVSGYQCLSLK